VKGAGTRGPLADLLIVDLTRVLAGPYCTMVLADLGARVIKVERPEVGDDARAFPPFVDDQSAYFASLNRGKESIALDLKAAPDREIFEALLGRADVLVENYRAGTLDRLGYDWERLHREFPRLILASASGFGQTGPYATRPAYDMVVQAMGGVMSLTGHPGGPPTRVGSSVGDITAGLLTAVGILTALHHRSESGQAQRVDVAMLDGQVAILENAIARYVASGTVPGPLGARHPSIAPFEAYATADGHLVIAAGNDALFAACCEVLGIRELADDPRFADNPSRVAHVEALGAAFESQLAKANTREWLERLEAAGVPCGPIQNVEEVLRDPQVLARNMVIRAGGLKMAGNPVKISGFPDPEEREPAPALDAQRRSILRELKG
jgi:CoA:oxalate CoA-transferase